MSRVYDNWERLVEAVLDREQLRYLALCPSLASSRSTSSFSFDSDVVSASSSSTILISYRQVKPMEYDEIKKATNNFRTDWILGGGFGRVYKGWVHEDTLTASKPGSGMAVSVEILNPESLQHVCDEWWKELYYMRQLRHPNIIKLFGYCGEKDNRILVHEFMSKGSLDNHLFGRGHQSLSWTTRIKVAIDVARALSFLHRVKIPKVYCGFNAGDILLDGEFNAKLSHFGLATGDISTRGHLTKKCVVFDYGVVLLQLLCGRRVIDRNRVAKDQNLLDWAKPYLGDKKRLSRIIDTELEGQYSVKEIHEVALLALQCLSNMPKQRPTMAQVLVALEQL